MSRFQARVRERIQETDEAATLVLEAPARPDYRAGQFLTIHPHQFRALAPTLAYFEAVKGRHEPPRAYSLSSSPLEPHLALTVKEEVFVAGETPYPPLLSSYLVWAVPPGTVLDVAGFGGRYVLPDPPHLPGLLHLCAGSGIVPNFAILKEALGRALPTRHVLLYSNRRADGVIFREALASLAARHPDRLVVRHFVTRDPEGAARLPDARAGRIGRDDVARALRELGPGAGVYVCGSGVTRWERLAAEARGAAPRPRFVEGILTQLAALGLPPERIHQEVYA